MFNDIGGRVFFEQPAGEHLTPAFGLHRSGWAFKQNELHKRALIGVGFPRGRPFASPQPHNHLAKTQRFAGF
jgi:hypothetical protein